MDNLPGVTLHQLKVFATVVREGGFGRAAEVLLISEPSVSGHIKSLERVFGLRLIERARGRRRVEPTDAGRVLLSTCDEVFTALGQGVKQIQAIRQGAQATVRLAASPSFFGYFLPPVYQGFQRAHPNVEVRATVARRPDILEGLLQGSIDMGVVSGPTDHPELVSIPLLPYDLVAVGPHDHPLSTGPRQPFRALLDERIIVASEYSAPKRALERLARERGLRLQVALELPDVDSLLQAVVNGLGVTAVTYPTAAQRLADQRLSLLQVEGFPVRLTWYLVHAIGQLPLSVRQLKDYLLRWEWPSSLSLRRSAGEESSE